MKFVSYTIVIALALFLGTMYLQPEDEPSPNKPTSSLIDGSRSIPEMYEELMNEESKAQYDKMHAQMEEYQQKKEEHHNRWMLMVYICAAIAVIPTINMLGQFVLGKLELKSAKDVLYIFSVCIGLGVVLFAINLGAVYLMFYAERSIQAMALAAILFGGGAALWIASFRTKKKNP